SPAIAPDQTHQAAAAPTASVAAVAVVLPHLGRCLLSTAGCGHAVPVSSSRACRPLSEKTMMILPFHPSTSSPNAPRKARLLVLLRTRPRSSLSAFDVRTRRGLLPISRSALATASFQSRPSAQAWRRRTEVTEQRNFLTEVADRSQDRSQNRSRGQEDRSDRSPNRQDRSRGLEGDLCRPSL